MANFYKSEVVTAMREQSLVPVFYHADKETVLGIIGACVKGGSRLVEFTNRGEGAADLFGELIKVCRKQYPGLMVGVGSVRDEITAGIYIGKGADFVVGPTFNPKVSEICNRLGVSYSPGCGTASEINNAEAAGSEIIKVFPGGEVGGPAFFKAVHGPAARTQMMPTGGVEGSAESIYGWLVKGKAAALGIGSELIRKEHVAKKDFAAMEANVRRVLGIIQAVKSRALANDGVIFVGVRCVGVPTKDASATSAFLGGLPGLTLGTCAGSPAVSGRLGACLHLGNDPFIAVEVTDLDKALEILKKAGVKVDGTPEINAEKTAKYVILAEGALGLGARVIVFCNTSEELEKFLSK